MKNAKIKIRKENGKTRHGEIKENVEGWFLKKK
jgi:hypothetical protein